MKKLLNFLKEIIKIILPPFYYHIKNYIKFKKNPFKFNNNTYWGIYSDISEIKKDFKIDDYVNKEENERNFLNYKKQLLDFNFRESILPIFLSNLKLEYVNILDVGGGYNSVYKYLKYSINQKFDVTVLETPIIVDTINKSTNNNLTYISNINNILFSKYQIVYFGSSFQYFLKCDDILSKIFDINPLYIFIVDSSFLEEKESFLTLQVNMYPSLFPQRFNNIKEIIEKMNKHNYKLIYKSKRNAFKHNLLKSNESYFRDLIFEKNNI